jgi:enterochelin esterase family protein
VIRPLLRWFLVLSCCVASSLAQSPSTNNAAGSNNVRRAAAAPVISPEVSPDKRVTFRIRSADSRKVSVSGQAIARSELVPGSNDVWSVTVGPVQPGIWEYSFTLDGVQMIDPGNPLVKPQRNPRTSILHIPGANVWDFSTEVEHGTVHRHEYASRTLDRLRRYHVYTPPGYETSRSKSYPVLYLVHGFGDNDATWTEHGKAHWIFDNLIASGKAIPMIVVMPDGHPRNPEGVAREHYSTANNEAFARELIEEIIPAVEKRYRTRNGREHRALAGLSMGGGHTLFTGLTHREKFGWLGAFSAGIPSDERLQPLLNSPDKLNKAFRRVWIACGKDDFLIERNRQFNALLEQKGIRHEWRETAGDHSWPVWRGYLGEFVPLLFQKQ